MVIWKRGWAAFEEDRSPRVVDGRKTYDKSGWQRRGTGIPSQTEIGIREERKRVRASKSLLVGDGDNLIFSSGWPGFHVAWQ
jgi:hypothetical protein